MDPAYRVQLATWEHIPHLADIEVAAGALFPDEDIAPELRQEGLPRKSFEQAARAGRLWTTVEKRTEQPVGFALAILVDSSAHLYELDVLPDHGRRGLGAALVETVAQWALTQGHSTLTLTTFRHLPWNAPFYRRLGFEELSSGQLQTELLQCLRSEAADGLDPSKRIAMRRTLNPLATP